jgi:hypothetical protein
VGASESFWGLSLDLHQPLQSKAELCLDERGESWAVMAWWVGWQLEEL